jgi:hypothetical protein
MSDCRSRNTALRLATLSVAVAACASAHAQDLPRGLQFEDVFSARGEPASLHYAVELPVQGTSHHLEVWRDGDSRVRRSTDGVIDVYALKQPEDGEFRLSVLDRKRHIHNIIDRTNLYRIGNFTDWYDLAHGLRHPVGTYSLQAAAAPIQEKPAGACQWYDLTTKQTTHICWSQALHIPVLIVAQDANVVWRVTSADSKALSANTFVIHDEGYVRNDTNADIEND